MYICTILAVTINIFVFPDLLNHPDMKLNDMSYLTYDREYINKNREIRNESAIKESAVSNNVTSAQENENSNQEEKLVESNKLNNESCKFY